MSAGEVSVAVEAGARAVAIERWDEYKSPSATQAFDDLSDYDREQWLKTSRPLARAAITAALPHLSPRPDVCMRLDPEVGHEHEGYSCSTHNMPWGECAPRPDAKDRGQTVEEFVQWLWDEGLMPKDIGGKRISTDYLLRTYLGEATPAPAPVDDREALAADIERGMQANYGLFVRGTNVWRLHLADHLLAAGYVKGERTGTIEQGEES